MYRFLFIPLAAIFILCAGQSAIAGPPLVCHPLSIGNAESLPAGDGPFGSDPDYKPHNLPKETMAYLDADVPVIVRMETIRRAVLYVTDNLYGARHGNTYQGSDKERISGLLDAFQERVAEQNDASSAYAHALFDYGYLSACLKQAYADTRDDGYATVKRANSLLGGNPEMQFALAMISKHPKRDALTSHLVSARQGAERDALLALNLQKQFKAK